MGKTYHRSKMDQMFTRDFDAWADRRDGRDVPDQEPAEYDPARERAEDAADIAMARSLKERERGSRR
jgi:hypothetical protein